MAFASVQVSNPDAAAREGSCVLRISDGTGPDDGLSADQPDLRVRLSRTERIRRDRIALQGAASKPAGTYNVQLACSETSGEPLTAIRANLSVLASDN